MFVYKIELYVTWHISNILFIIREVNSDMPIYINRTNAGKIKCPEWDSNPRHPDLMKGALTTELPRQPQRSESNISYGSSVVRAPFMRSGCRGFESHSGHLIFSSICSVYIDRHIRVDLSDDEQNRTCLMLKPKVKS